ncbi:alpha/beta fold hydrolase [Streptomyces sp. NBC_01481]|uniref:alpha/beta fold hydrolase n=1 Tax=Streptomyces sp. NBC_01481 TaxID=2975869 RepID=UPI00225C00A1|nr:alpha/beta hydrolase [Streptomyces sp. NBC_01481]MCX4586237.1 alpha/beta hydrolase [Streptomyces sp. NBC_01481]
MTQSYAQAPIKTVSAANGIEYAYREVGEGGVPLVLLMHFRGNLDYWDPALVDALAQGRRVIAFDNTGVGGSSGTSPSTVTQMALDAIAFIDALDLAQVDILGFSLGSFVAQEIALIRPALVRRLVLASAAPQGAPGMHGWAQWVIDSVGKPEVVPALVLDVFYTHSPESRLAGEKAMGRMFSRAELDAPTTWQTRQAQYDAVTAWGIPSFSLLERVTAIRAPVFVAGGDSDPMILPRYSHLLAGLIPGAEIKIYPDAAHGFLFQHHEEFARDVKEFLERV